MGGKKSIIAMFLVVILAGGAGLGYSWHRESVNVRTFSGSGYQLSSGESAVSFTDCIWKLDADKYLLRSDNIQMSFAADDVRDAGEFVEVTYIDNGVIQLQTADNLWQTISENCEAILSSGERVNLSRKNVTDAAGNVLIDFAKIVVGSDDNIEITPDTKSLKDQRLS